MAWLRRNARKAPLSLRRSFVTPEGVDLRIELGSAGERAGAFVIDVLAILVLLIVATIAIAYLAWASHQGAFAVLWLLGFFVLRNGWFALVGLRVVARDGARLTGGAVIARNAMREIELFLPLSFLGSQAVHGWADSALTLFALGWSGIFLFFPLFNRDRLRVGDLLAGTWVVHTVRGKLGSDLVVPVERERRVFSEAALGLYGVYELQMLEEVLRGGSEEAIVTVAATIRRKAGLPDDHDDRGFLTDYYAALCGRLERGLLVGRRRADKFA